MWGHDREEARRRMLRALRETEIEGLATTIPADVAILEHPDFINVSPLHQLGGAAASTSPAISLRAAPPPPPAEDGAARVQRDVDVEVDGRRFQVAPVGAGCRPGGGRQSAAGRPQRPRPAPGGRHGGGAGSGQVTVPMQGTIVKVLVAVGDAVEVGQTVTVLEAMKMENNITAEAAGTVTEVRVAPGDAVGGRRRVVVIE